MSNAKEISKKAEQDVDIAGLEIAFSKFFELLLSESVLKDTDNDSESISIIKNNESQN